MRRAERLGDARDGLDRFGKDVLLEIAAGDRDAQPADALGEQRQRPARPAASVQAAIVGIGALHRIIGRARDRVTLRANGPR